MSDMKCPYCNKTLHCGATLKSDEHLIDLYQCANSECESTEFLVGCKEFWDILGQLIRTRKALKTAVDALKEYADRDNWGVGFAPWAEDGFNDALYTEDGYKTAKKALEQITALEQKDK